MQKQTNRWLVLIAVLLAFTPVVVDMTILHIAIPSLSFALNATGTEILWIIDIYPLIMAGLLVPMGSLADRVGHRCMLLTGMVIFTVASTFAAFAPSAAMLIAARVLLAVGGAMIMPCILAIIRQTFEDSKELGVALGLWSTVSAAGSAIGPLAGGFLLEHFWWGSVFLINLPVMLLVWPIAFIAIPKRIPDSSASWSITQALVLIAGLIATVYAIKAGFKPATPPLLTVATLLAGLALLTIFVRQQLCSAAPMLDLKLFAKPAISAGIIMALVVSGALAGVELTIAQELQFVVGQSPLQAGLFMMPLIVATAVGGPIAGWLASAVGLRLLASVSLIVSAACLVGLGMSDLHQIDFTVIALLATLGFVLSLGLTASSIAIMGSTPASKAGAAGALEGTGYELGAGLGITMFGVLLSASYSTALGVPSGYENLPASAFDSIGETIAATQGMGASSSALLESAKTAFISAHTTVLFSAAAAIAILSIFVIWALRNYQDEAGAVEN